MVVYPYNEQTTARPQRFPFLRTAPCPSDWQQKVWGVFARADRQRPVAQVKFAPITVRVTASNTAKPKHSGVGRPSQSTEGCAGMANAGSIPAGGPVLKLFSLFIIFYLRGAQILV